MRFETESRHFRVASGRRSLAWSVAAALLLQSACNPAGTTNNNPPTCTVSGVTVVANPTSLNPGATAALTATVNASSVCGGRVTWSSTPTGGTLTPNGLLATFTSTTANTYTI